MSRKYHHDVIDYPRRLPTCYDSKEDVNQEKPKKLLTFVDFETGTKARLVKKDPISGLGNLSEEFDQFKGNNLRPKSALNTYDGTGPRNPVLMEGDLGKEYNCMYTLKDVKCKEKENRNIITLEGELGKELDVLRPHAGRPRHSAENSKVVRDPITGYGNFQKEWDPIWKYEGKKKTQRYPIKQSDPISHRVPEETEDKTRTGIRYFHQADQGNIILDNGVLDKISQRRRGFPPKDSYNPIYHDAMEGSSDEEQLHGGGNKKMIKQKGRPNPITHQKHSDDEEYEAEEMKVRRPMKEKPTPRDPISGDGVEGGDTMDLWRYGTGGFRSYLYSAAAKKK